MSQTQTQVGALAHHLPLFTLSSTSPTAGLTPHLHPAVNTHLLPTCKMPARFCKYCLHGFLCKQFFANLFFSSSFLTGKCPQRQPTHQTKLSASNPAVRGVGMEAWQKPGEVNSGMAPGLSHHLPAGWGSPGGSGTGLQPGTEPDTGTRMLQTFTDRNPATAVSVSWQTMCQGSDWPANAKRWQ